jgi:hypothetical protein
MRFAFPKLALTALSLAALAPAACHNARAADPPRALAPTIDVTVEDGAPNQPNHAARFALSVVDGHAQLKAHDGDADYALSAHTARPEPNVAPHFSLQVKRSGTARAADLDLSSAIPLTPGARVVIAKIDRADGRRTSIFAQVR